MPELFSVPPWSVLKTPVEALGSGILCELDHELKAEELLLTLSSITVRLGTSHFAFLSFDPRSCCET